MKEDIVIIILNTLNTTMVNLIKDSERGDLMAFDTIDVPFYVKRFFVVNNVPKCSIRGQHAHKECKQYFICINGEIIVTKHGQWIELKKGDSIFIDNLEWSTQHYFTEGAELMVLCSHEYDKNDYITDFEEFKRLANG